MSSALLWGVRSTQYLDTTFNGNEGFASDMTSPANTKFGLDIGYALLLLLCIISAALLAYLFKPQPKVPAPLIELCAPKLGSTFSCRCHVLFA
jgi:hypothetical protein